MRKTQGFIELAIGLLGLSAILCLGSYWTYIPLVVYGVLSIALIRRIGKEQLTKDEEQSTRKRNVTTLIGWAFAAVICFITFKDSRMGEGGVWFILSAYVFLLMHGIAFMAPINSFPNERNEGK